MMLREQKQCNDVNNDVSDDECIHVYNDDSNDVDNNMTNDTIDSEK